MHEYKVTKYDPRFYGGPGGAYTRDEWTAYSDIGRTFDGVELTTAEYERVEGLYLDAVRIAVDACGADQVQVRGLEQYEELPGAPQLTDDEWISASQAVEVCRLMLREAGIWCRLEVPDRFYVHIGWDYYMYVGTSVDVRPRWAELEARGLFVEENSPSPYAEDDSG